MQLDKYTVNQQLKKSPHHWEYIARKKKKTKCSLGSLGEAVGSFGIDQGAELLGPIIDAYAENIDLKIHKRLKTEQMNYDGT